MKVSCANCPLREHHLFDAFSQSEIEFMSEFKSGELTVEPGTTVLSEGSHSPQFYTVLSGMGLRYKLLENGNRQVVGFVFPGDLVGLQSSIMEANGHSFESTTDMTLCVFNRDKLWSLYRSHPERAFDLTWLAATEEHFLGEVVATLGQRNATQRVAWAVLKIYERLRAVSLGEDGWVPFTYRQRDLADALGLSLVHTNKTLKRLAHDGLASWDGTRLAVHDREALEQVAMDSDLPLQRPLL